MINDEVRKTRELYGDNQYNPLEERILFRPLSKKLARFLMKTSIHPDQVSVFGFLLTIGVSCLFVYTNTPWWAMVVLLFTCMFFDKVDGDLARAKGIASTKGQYIDGTLDAVGEVILVSAIAVVVHPAISLAMLSSAAVVFFNYHGAAAPLYLTITPTAHAESRKGLATRLKELFFYGRAKLFLAIIFLLIINHLSWLFILLPLLFPYTLLIFARNIFVKGLTKR